MYLTPTQFKEGLPIEKRKKDSIILRYVFRPISFYVASFASKLNISANRISFVSMIIAIISGGLFLINNYTLNIIAAVLVSVWMILDCADGNIARCVQKHPYGEFADALSSYVLLALLFSSVGISVYNTGGVFVNKGSIGIVIIGFLASVSDTLARLSYQKYLNISEQILSDSDDLDESSTITKKSRLVLIHDRIDKEIGLNGLMLPGIIICTVFSWLDIFLIFYSAFYVGTLIVTWITLFKKSECLK